MSFHLDIEAKLNTFQLHVRLDSEKMNAGQVIGLLGASGSGKTMTLRYISGTAVPDSGRILVNETTFFDKEKKINLRPQERRVGYLFQNYALFPNMTVLQNVECGIIGADTQQKKREAKKLRQEKARDAIRRVHLEGLESRKPYQLSGGQQQRCALARILVGDPQIVLLDEPFSALDEYLRDMLMEETMTVLKSLKIPVFFVTHSRSEARYACTDIAVIHDGIIQETGKTEEIFTHPSSEWGRILTGIRS